MRGHLQNQPAKLLVARFVALIALMLLAGCGQGPELGDAAKTDSNGYICGKCNFKFYTDASVFAEFCPKCKDTFIQQVVAYRCEKDQHMTISSNRHGSQKCELCSAQIDGLLMPQAKDLKAWGAEKEDKAAVCK